MTSEQINAILAQLQGLGPLQVQRQVANRDSVDNGGMGSGAADTFSNEALARLLPGVRISPMQGYGHTGGDNSGFYDDPSQGYHFFQDVGGNRFLQGTIGPDGRVVGLRERSDSGGLLGRTFDKLGSVLTSPIGGPLAVLAAPFAFGAAFGGAGAPAAAAPGSGGYFGGLSAGAGGQTGLTLGAGATGLTAPAGFTLAPELGAGLAGAGAGTVALTPPGGEGYFGGLNPGASGQGLQMPGAPAAPGMGGGQGLVPAQAAVAPQSSLVTAAAAPISASQASYAASPVKLALDAAKPYASLVGPGMSLLGALQAPQAPQDLGPARVPGVESPPESRGLDRQAARSPILDVLGRNRRENRNRTMLTGPGGVSMESVRVAANTLLGL